MNTFKKNGVPVMGTQNIFDYFNVKNDDYQQAYDDIKEHCDPEGWVLYEACKEILEVDVYKEFYEEDTLGWFENSNGHALKIYCEIAKFGNRKYKQVGCYEVMESYTLDLEYESYQEYLQQLHKLTLLKRVFGF